MVDVLLSKCEAVQYFNRHLLLRKETQNHEVTFQSRLFCVWRNVVFLCAVESGSHYGPSFQNLIYSFIFSVDW